MPMSRCGDRVAASCLIALPLLVVLLVLPARAQDIPEDGAMTGAMTGAGQDLYLEVVVNGQPRNLIARFTDLGDRILSADAADLRNSGILAGDEITGEVRLDQIPGLGWRLIEPEQTIRFIVPPDVMAPFDLSAAEGPVPEGAPPDEGEGSGGPPVDRGYGLVLNYGLNLERWQGEGGLRGDTMSGSFDARAFMPLGVLSHGFVIAPEDADGRSPHRYRRLETSWRSSFPGRAVQLQLGDVASRGPAWSRPLRLGGVMVERNFGLRPDIVTIPLAGFEGTAELPSTVEVFSNAIRAYSAEVPAGPFSIRDLPLAAGAGVAQVVVRDIAGRERRLDLPFLVSDRLLRPGVVDFAMAAGRPRLGIGTDSDRYDGDLFGVGTLRFGVSDALTLSAHLEGGRDLQMGGIGTTMRVAHLGTLGVHLAGSRSARGTGGLIDLSTSLSWGPAVMSARLSRTTGHFADAAAVSAEGRPGRPRRAAFPERLAQMSFSMPLGARIGGGASLFLSDIVQPGTGGRETSLGASYSRTLWGDSSVTLSATALRGARRDSAVAIQFQMPLGERHHASALSERRAEGWRHYAQISGRSERALPHWNWRLQADQGDGRRLRAQVGVQGQHAQVEVAARQQPGSRAVGLRLDGAVVASGGGVFLSRPVHDAFAVVDAGAPGVEVSAENRPVGRTNRSGRILLPDLRAYEANTVSIDPLDLPLDAATEATRQVVRPAYRSGARVGFGVQTSAREALIGLVDDRGRPLEVGGRVVVNGDETGPAGAAGDLVGFDGETFLTGLQDSNVIEVSYPDGRRCRAEIAYTDEPGVLTQMRGVPCL